MQPGRDRQLVTASVLLGMFLAALEATAVAAAVPTAIGELGGVSRYSWVFSAYLLTSTTTVPLYGKLADLYGRKPVYHAAVGLFLLGSALSGMAGSLGQLALFRAIQGLGAGGVMPIAATLIGDIYTLEERGRVQGLFSGVWALASLVGPVLGGAITDLLSWRWIFYLSIPFGAASALLLRSLREEPQRREHRLDLAGTVSLTAAVGLLMLALTEGPGAWGWTDGRTLGLLAGAAVALALFFRQELRAPEPMLPLSLFRNRMIAVASLGNAVLGIQLFALSAFVPMFAQGVLGGTAVDAGATLTPALLGWPIGSTLAGRILLRTGYRRLAVAGGVLLLAGGALLAAAGDLRHLVVALFLTGLGLGLSSMPYLLGVQSAVPWGLRGVATGSVQFFRSIGGAIGVAALGALLAARVAGAGAGGLDPDALLDPALRARAEPAVLAALTSALRQGLETVFLLLAAVAAAGLLVALFVPGGRAEALAHREPDEEPARRGPLEPV